MVLCDIDSTIYTKIKKQKIDKEKIVYLHRLFRDDDESIAKQDIKLTTSSSINFVFDRLISYAK